MEMRRWIRRRLWGRGRTIQHTFIHPTCGQADVEVGYLPEWGRPRFLCRRCGVVFDEASVRLEWKEDRTSLSGSGPIAGGADR
jgi:hypothetical protein